MAIDPATVYLIAKAAFDGGKFAYKIADKRVGAWADEQGISKKEAWRIVRAEAARRGDASMETAADAVLKLGWKAFVIPGGTTAYVTAHGWKAAKRRFGSGP